MDSCSLLADCSSRMVASEGIGFPDHCVRHTVANGWSLGAAAGDRRADRFRLLDGFWRRNGQVPEVVCATRITTRTKRFEFALGKLCTSAFGPSSALSGADDLLIRTVEFGRRLHNGIKTD